MEEEDDDNHIFRLFSKKSKFQCNKKQVVILDTTMVRSSEELEQTSRGLEKEPHEPLDETTHHNISHRHGGVLVSVDPRNRERECRREILNLLNRFSEEFLPSKENDDDQIVVSMTIEDCLLREIQLIKSRDRSFNKKRFYHLDTGVGGMFFVRFAVDIEILPFVSTLFEKCDEQQTRYAVRVMPIETTCQASRGAILSTVEPLIRVHFPRDRVQQIKTFAVNWRCRNNTKISDLKADITNKIAGLVGYPHKVNLTNPDVVIIIQICKFFCGISVVCGRDFRKFFQFNMRRYCEEKRKIGRVGAE